MSPTEPCRRHVLAQAPGGYRVDRCSCGLIHVYAGPVTLRLEPEACEQFTTVLAAAMAELAQLGRQEARPALRLVPADGGELAAAEQAQGG